MRSKELQARLSEQKNREVVHPFGDPQFGDLATPINTSHWVRTYLNYLPAVRQGLTPLQRGLEVGMVHGYWLVGPFARLGPLRDSAIANLVGFLCAVVLVVISTFALGLYALSNPPAPIAVTAPDAFRTSGGWSRFANGFLIGGVGGAIVAWLVLIGVGLFGKG
ncbi:photosystem I reaction center subunit XI [Leptothermofonsia sp. ETS-13]|uniref:photosystem I reaction center subunit XI n=1 Tax=Leptothermofonsia sp. ETS-13 TaxID=3035696 RepID=UPI003BA33D2E